MFLRYGKIWLIAAFLLVVMSVFPAVTAQTVKNPDTIIEVWGEATDTLEPAYAYNTFSMEPIQNMYETLISYAKGTTGAFVPKLATTVPSIDNGLISPDGLTYTFPIRKGIKFHNGDELTPEDVEYSFERAMVLDPAGGPIWTVLNALLGVSSTRGDNGLQVTFDQIDKAIEVDGDNVVFHLAKPFPAFLQILALPWCSIVDKSWVIEQGGWPGTAATWEDYNNPKKEQCTLFDKENGTGPFKLERWEQGSEIVLVRNDDYWQGPAKTKRAIIKTVPEWSTRLLMLKTGDADIVEVPRQFLPQVEQLEGVTVTKDLPQLAITAIFFNQAINPKGNPYIGSGKLDGKGIPPDFFSDIAVRKAFNYTFDWKTYINDVYGGAAIQAKGPIPRGVPFYNPDQETYHYDPKKAEEFFKQAWGGKLWNVGFTFKLPYISGISEYKAAVDLLRMNLKRINPKFNIEAVALPWATLYDAEQNKWMPLDVGWWGNDYPDPDNDAFPFMHSQGYYSSKQGFNKYDQLVEKGASTLDPTVRKEVYFELQKLAFEDAIDVFLIQPTQWHVAREWLKGWYPCQPWLLTDFYPLWKE